ncbi:hypothetical protein OAE37_01365 [Pirellulaceae bacterium]|jgi:hypothetical protein|nr:hypothetical protein [Pirellulaceae bacterium]
MKSEFFLDPFDGLYRKVAGHMENAVETEKLQKSVDRGANSNQTRTTD